MTHGFAFVDADFPPDGSTPPSYPKWTGKQRREWRNEAASRRKAAALEAEIAASKREHEQSQANKPGGQPGGQPNGEDVPPYGTAEDTSAQGDGPQFISWGSFIMASDGLTTKVVKGKGDNATVETIWVAAAFEVIGASRSPSSRDWGKWLRWCDADGRVHTRHVTEQALQGDPSVLCGGLAGEGLSINPNQQRAFRSYTAGCNVETRVTVVPRTGWHIIGDHHVFALPAGTLGPIGSEQVILDASVVGPYEVRGTLKDWQEGIGALSSGHAVAVFSISAAFAGPLIYLAGQEGGGVHIFGGSSEGKSTLTWAGATVWGKGSLQGYVRSWRATANGLEGGAASSSDTGLFLDEMGSVEPREMQAAVYMLTNGAGKARAARDGSLREPKMWRSFIISSGEIPTSVKLGEDRGRKARAGQLVRMLDIQSNRDKGFGSFDHGGPDNDAAALSGTFQRAAVSAYGTAGPEFVRRIIAEGVDEIGRAARDAVTHFVKKESPAGADGQVTRAAQRLGLIAAAGELATAMGLVPWQVGEAREAAAWAQAQWIAWRGGTESAEVRQAVEQVRLFIEQYGESRFDNLDDVEFRPAHNRAGWHKGRGAEREWLVPPEVWKQEICNGLDPVRVARALAERGMLLRVGDGFQPVRKIDGANKRVYVVTTNIFEGGTADES